MTVHDGEDNDGGDEPYVIQVGFRSKVGVPDSSSTSISAQCYANKLPAANAAPNGAKASRQNPITTRRCFRWPRP